MKINIELSDNVILIKGDIDSFLKPRIKSWFNVKFKEVRYEENQIFISDPIFNKKEEINKFRESIIHKTGNLKIDFGTNFSRNLKEYKEEEDRFKEFSLYAKSIWSRRFDESYLEDFENFKVVLENKLPKRKLYKLQLLSSFHLAFSQNACNFSVPGAGKTSIVYGAYTFLKNLNNSDPKKVNKLIVVGPPSSFEPWIDEYIECFGEPPKVFRFTGESEKDEKLRVLSNTHKIDYELLLFTYNSIPILFREIISYCSNVNNKVMFVCDEAHKIKSEDGLWSNSVLKISPYLNSRVILTGTPAPNGYEDLFNLFKFIYPSKNIIEFRRDYLKRMTKDGLYSEIDSLIESIKPYFIRIKKSDLNLPDVNDFKFLNDVDELERDVYLKLEKSLHSKSNDVSLKSIYFRLHQSVNNIHLLKSRLNNFDFDEAESLNENLEKILGEDLYFKIKYLDDNYIPSKHMAILKHVLDLSKKGKKVIIWGFYIDSIKRLDKLLKKNGLDGGILIGETPKGKKLDEFNWDDDELNRQTILKKFKLLENFNYIITNPIVLGESVSLHKVCNNSIYFELNWNAAPYIQSRDRIHRVWLINGKQHNYETNYFHYLSSVNQSKEDIDEKIYTRLNMKFKRMLEIIEHEIPLFQEEESDEILAIMNDLIIEYGGSQN